MSATSPKLRTMSREQEEMILYWLKAIYLEKPFPPTRTKPDGEQVQMVLIPMHLFTRRLINKGMDPAATIVECRARKWVEDMADRAKDVRILGIRKDVLTAELPAEKQEADAGKGRPTKHHELSDFIDGISGSKTRKLLVYLFDDGNLPNRGIRETMKELDYQTGSRTSRETFEKLVGRAVTAITEAGLLYSIKISGETVRFVQI